jgi:hypothetical protein
MKLRAEIPSFLHKQKQFSTSDANRTRLLTKLRWVVESGNTAPTIFSFDLFILVNSKIKCWKYFAQTIRNSTLPTVGIDLDIICAIQNKYFRPALNDRLGGEQMAEIMKSLLNAPNPLHEFLEVNPVLKWKKFDALYCTFPMLMEDDIREITFG